ncbi:MAG: hypothetical protein DSY76_08705, partial [Bacteroidetes bacterium]
MNYFKSTIKIASTFALLFIFTTQVLGQEQREEILKYDNGKTSRIAHYINDTILDGEWLSFYANGNKLEQGNYSNGEKTGEWIYLLENGDTLSQINYNNGIYRIWFSKGKLQVEGQVKDGEKQG